MQQKLSSRHVSYGREFEAAATDLENFLQKQDVLFSNNIPLLKTTDISQWLDNNARINVNDVKAIES